MADEIAEMLVKVKGDVSDLLAKYEAGKRGTKDFEDTVDRSSKKVKDDFDGMGKSNSQMADTIRKNSRDGETSFQSLTRRSAELRQEMANLRTQFLHTSNIDAFSGFQKAEAELKRIDTIGKTLGVDFTRSAKQTRSGWLGLFEKLATSAKEIGPKLMQGLTDSLSKDVSGIGEILANPVTLAGVVVAVAAWSPLIAGAVSAGVTAGAGLGLVAAAVLVQKNNPVIVSAFKELSSQVKAVLQDATQPLVGPMADALKSIENFVTNEGPQIAKVFAPLGPAIHMMAVDFEALIHDILPPLANLSAEFTSAFQSNVVQAALANLSHEFAALFQTIANHPQLIREGFLFIAGAIQFAIGFVNDFIKVAGIMNTEMEIGANIITGHWGKAWDLMKNGAQESVEPITQFGFVVNGIALGTPKATSVINDLGRAVTNLANAIVNQLVAAFDTYINKSLDASNATITFKNDLANLDASLKANGRSFDLNTQKGRDNQSMLNQSISDMKQSYDSAVKNGTGIDKATLAYQIQLNQLKANLAAQGLTSAQIAKLTRQYELLPAQKATLIKALGTGAAQTAIDGILGGLGKLPKSKSVNIFVKTFGVAAAQAAVAGILGGLGKANSGIVNNGRNSFANSGIAHFANSGATGIYPGVSGGMYRFAESSTGEEALIARNGDRNRALSSLSTAAGWFGKDVTLSRNLSTGMNYASAGGGGGSVFPLYASIVIDGKTVVRALTPAAQKRGHRNGGTTGLA